MTYLDIAMTTKFYLIIIFSISKNASIEEYREFSGGVYTHPNKRSLLNTCEIFSHDT
jgi:hypothetical protein